MICRPIIFTMKILVKKKSGAFAYKLVPTATLVVEMILVVFCSQHDDNVVYEMNSKRFFSLSQETSGG